LTEPLRCDKIFLDLLDIIAAFSSQLPTTPNNFKGTLKMKSKIIWLNLTHYVYKGKNEPKVGSMLTGVFDDTPRRKIRDAKELFIVKQSLI